MGKGDHAFVERVLEGTPPRNHTHPFPEICNLDNAEKDNVRIYIHEGTSEAWLFNGQNLRCAVSVSKDYRPYRHKSRTLFFITPGTGPRSAVGNVSGYRCVSDCISRGREFDPGPVPYFRGD